MIPLDLSSTPHRRGVGHLSKYENVDAEAAAAFSEAIRLDPDGPEKTAWDRLVNRSSRRFGQHAHDSRNARSTASNR